MKLLFVTSLKEYQSIIADIFGKAGIPIFSVTETIGIKDHSTLDLLNNWFGKRAEQFDSIFVFSFTEESSSEKAMELITEYNAKYHTGFPIRAFIVPVEKATHSTSAHDAQN